MSAPIDLKEIERKAFRSTYQDGLWDIYLGLVVIFMSIFVYRPAEGYTSSTIVLAMLGIFFAYGLFWAGKKYLTVPRMGLLQFGETRKQKKTFLAFLLTVIVIVQVAVVLITALAWQIPSFGARVSALIGGRVSGPLVVAAVGSLFIGPPMILISYVNDFSRGYYIGVLMSLAVFLMIYLNQPVYPIVIGMLILIPGIVLLVRFLKAYPLRPGESSNG